MFKEISVQKSVVMLWHTNWPVCGEGDQVTLLYLACAHAVCTVLCCAVHVLGRALLAVSPGPPRSAGHALSLSHTVHL